MNTQRFLVIILWRRAQQYRKPNPPWIALYTSLLDHPAWLGLDDASRSLLVSLWLYAARTGVDGRVWGDPAYLRSVLPVNGPVDLRPLLEAKDGDGNPFPFIRWEDDPPCAREVRSAKREASRSARRDKAKPARVSDRPPATDEAAKREAAREASARYRARKKAQRNGVMPGPAGVMKNVIERERGGRGGEREAQAQAQAQTQRQSEACDSLYPAEAEVSARTILSGGQPQAHGQGQGQGQAQAQAQAQSPKGAPAIVGNPTPPGSIRLDPPVSDGVGARRSKVGFTSKGPSRRRGRARLLGESLPETLKAMADPVKYEWLAELYRRLGFGYPMDSPLGRQEIGSFASVYEALMAARLPASDKAEILAHDLDWARVNGQKRRNRKRGAVFNMVHKERVATYLARRAGQR